MAAFYQESPFTALCCESDDVRKSPSSYFVGLDGSFFVTKEPASCRISNIVYGDSTSRPIFWRGCSLCRKSSDIDSVPRDPFCCLNQLSKRCFAVPKCRDVLPTPFRGDRKYTIQEFEGGVIYYTSRHDSVTVPKAFMDYLTEHPGIRQQLGVPVKRPQDSPPDAPVQFFEHGVITNTEGQINAWIRATPIQGPDPGEIDLIALDCNTETAVSGQTISLEYRIRSQSGRTVLVGLGASLIAGNGDEYFDTATDRHVPLTPGEASYCRRLQIPPATPEGAYRLVGGIWYPNFGDQRLTKIDCGFVLTVSAKSAGEPN